MNRPHRLGTFLVACVAAAIVLLLIHWRGQFWTFWVWLWS
jgi:hypothetical protein